MPSTQREHSDERSERLPLSKLPMWDSSDPDRNPPPLPLNPQASPATVRSGAAPSIVQAAQMFTEKPRESSVSSQYTTNPPPERSAEKSPERSLIKGAAHRRLQSVRDIRNVLDGRKTPERSPERSSTPSFTMPTSPEPSVRAETPTRRSSIRPTKAILGENTPPSATMLALQTMTVREYTEPSATNSNIGSTARTPQSFETILDQMASLTNIATSLQKEMAHLTRRSKDNASDLLSLKEATNSRDEDIRKSLKDLLKTVTTPQPARSPVNGGAASVGSRNVNDLAGTTTPPQAKAYTLPRIASPGALFEEGISSRIESPRPFSVEGAASVAMLEKIIREMVTKDGQERLLTQLNELFEKASQENGTTAKKVADLVEFIKEGPSSRALVQANGNAAHQSRPSLYSNNSTSSALMLGSRDLRGGSVSTLGNDSTPFVKASDFVNDEVANLLKKIKDSVFHSGQVMSEVKAQQRDLRHEVLGIGRNLAQKIDEARKPASKAKAIEDGSGKQDIARIVTEGLSELKAHLDNVMREKRRQSTSSTISRTTVDNREIYDVVKHTLNERGLGDMQIANVAPASNLDKEAIVDAIKEAYEAYQPNIKVQQFGLERDEILECLKEGLDTYKTTNGSSSLNRAEILEIIHEAMSNFSPPKPINEVHEVREEVLSAVRECLDELRPSLASQVAEGGSRHMEILPAMIADAVRSGMRTDGPLASQQLEICADDLFDAVTRALDESRNPLGRFGDEIRGALTNIISDLHEQFKQYSAAHGRDTEQVLDAMRDGQECLRADIEQYVDRAQDVTGKDEIIDEVRRGVSQMLQELEQSIAAGLHGDARCDMAYIRNQFQKLDDTISNLATSDHHRNVVEALHLGFDELRTSGSRGISTISDDNAFGEAVRGELESVRDAIIMRSEGHKEEILDSVKVGFDILEAKIGIGAFDEVKTELEHLRSTISTNEMPNSSASRELMEDIHINLKDLKSHLVGDDSPSTTLLATIHAEFQNLRASLNSGTMSRSIAEDEEDEVIDSLRDTLDAIKQASGAEAHGISTEALQHVSVKLAEVVQAVNSNRDNSKADYEELLTTVRCGLDDLRADILKKLDNPDGQIKAYGQILDTINESGEALKSELAETISKPIDMTVCYDILEALKDGMANIKTDIAALKTTSVSRSASATVEAANNEMILSEGQDSGVSRAVASGSLHRDDITQVEVMLASLQVKVDAMSASISDLPMHSNSSTESTSIGDTRHLEDMLKDMQATLDLIASREESEGMARKEDTDAIETLLRNTKAHLEEVHPSGSTTIVSEQLTGISEKLENAIGGMSEELKDEIAKKEDLDVLQQLVLDLKPMIDGVKTAQHSNVEEQSKALGVSIDALQILALEVKEKVLELHLHQADHKSGVGQLTGLVHDFRDSHDRLKESYENDIGITARAFDDRKKEAEHIVKAVELLQNTVELLKLDMSARMTSTGDDVVLLAGNVTSMEETIKDHFAINEAVREIREKLEREFERVVGVVEALKSDNDTRTAALDAKHDEVRLAVVAGVSAKVADHCDKLTAKYDDARAESLAATADQRDILESTKLTAADLQISVDTLGATVTGLKEDCERLTYKVSESSEAVFSRMEHGFSELQDPETRTIAGKEHRETRDEVRKVLTAVDALQGDVTEYHPRFMVTLQEIHELVNQQMEHTKKTKEELAERDRAHQETSRSITDEIKTSFSSLPALLPPPMPALESADKIDSSAVHAKLDEVLLGIADSNKATPQLEYLKAIQEQVAANNAALTTFIASQTRLITEGPKPGSQEVQESAVALERHNTSKQHLESEVELLRQEKDSIVAIVAELRAERDSLVSEKAKLAADVSALNTALHIRKDELHAMDVKADALERRILEGIMDQSRAMLLARGMKEQHAATRAVRAPSIVSQSTLGSLPSTHPAANGLSMAMKTRSAANARKLQQQQATGANTGRRILSLSQITGNTPTGAQAHRPLPAIPSSTNSLAVPNSILKRSQSVRSPAARKVSWNTRNAEKRRVSNGLVGAIHEDEDKENAGQLQDIHDEEEDESVYEDESVDDCGASTGTVNVHDIEHESVSSRRESAASTGTRESYETGDYLSGSDLSRRTSEVTDALHEESSEEESEHEDGFSVRDFAHEQPQVEMAARASTGADETASECEAEDSLGPLVEKELVIRPRDADADSGIGIDAPSSLMRSGSETSYFRRSAGEVSNAADH